MKDFRIKRNKNAKVDFTEWNFGEPKLIDLIDTILNKALSDVFSEKGANASISIDSDRQAPNNKPDLKISCRIEIEEYQAYAKEAISLRELLEFECGFWRYDERKKVSETLHYLADNILQDHD